MKKASILLMATALISCKSVSLGGDEGDAGGQREDANTSISGSSGAGGSGGLGGTGPFDASALGGQGGGDASGTGSCPPRNFDADCAFGIATYTCVASPGGWVWMHTCPEQPKDGGAGGESGGTSPIDAPVERTCTYKGMTYPYGVTWKDECNTCSCSPVAEGVGVCTAMGCSVDAGMNCNAEMATKALSAAGIVTTGNGTTLDEILPANLASGANWGVKDIECREGGYDLSPFAGKWVCLMSFDTTDLCQQLPARAWVVMSEGTVRCIYKSAALNPGIYSVHDVSCSSPDAGTTACAGPNPADRSCVNWNTECVPSSCSCASNGSWNCTTDCRSLPACNAFRVSEGACQGKGIDDAQGIRLDNAQAATAFGRYVQSINASLNPLPKVEAAEQTVTNLWDVLEAQLFFAKIYAQDGSLWREVAFVHRHCGLTLLTNDMMFGLIQSGVVANGVFYYSWEWGSGLPRTSIGELYYSFDTPLKAVSPGYLNQTLVVGVEGANAVAYRATIGAKFNEWKNPVLVGSIQYIGQGLVLVDENGKEIKP